MTETGEFANVFTTCSTRDEAERIARSLVEARLAGCVQIEGPITSVYRWQGAVAQTEEWRLAIKTVRSRFEEVAAAIRQQHSYEVPEIVALPIEKASDDYANWLREQIK